MKSLGEIIGQMGVGAAIATLTPALQKERLMKLYQYGVIRPSLLQWAIAMKGLKHE